MFLMVQVGCLGEDEDFAEFRARVSDLIKDCVFILGSSTVFRQLVAELTKIDRGPRRTMT